MTWIIVNGYLVWRYQCRISAYLREVHVNICVYSDSKSVAALIVEIVHHNDESLKRKKMISIFATRRCYMKAPFVVEIGVWLITITVSSIEWNLERILSCIWPSYRRIPSREACRFRTRIRCSTEPQYRANYVSNANRNVCCEVVEWIWEVWTVERVMKMHLLAPVTRIRSFTKTQWFFNIVQTWMG